MDAQDHDGSSLSFGQFIRDFDILGRASTFDSEFRTFAYTQPEALAALAQAIAQGNSSLKNQILRHWGIR